ncbi:MAG: PKD domain-containing protein, partial [Nitrososphaerota archaeon]
NYETGDPTTVDPIDTFLDFISTDLSDPDGQPIPHDVEPATVRIWERIPVKIILKVDPPEIKQLESGTSFAVNVLIGLDPKKWNLTQFNATLSFNSTLIKAEGVTEGAWPKQYASTTTELLKQIDNETGTLQYALKFGPPLNSGAPSTGVLFTVTFYVAFESRVKITETPESCVIGLKPVTIIDETGLIPEEQLEITNSTYIAYRSSPVAKFTWSPFKQFLPRGQAITFNASESYHKLGLRIVNYTWDFEGVVRSTTSPIYTYTFATVGNKTVTLNVTDEGGYWSITKTYIGILDSPTASFKFTPLKPAVNQTILFNATNSLPGGAPKVSPEKPGYPAEIINYTWDFGDGTVISTTEKVTNYAYKHAGRYTVTLTVTNNYTLSHSYSLPITISKLNSTISINVSTTEAVVNSNVTISGEITPLRPQVNVTIYINNTAITVQTNENGQYIYKWTPTQVGTYSIKARWNGDQDTNPAESETLIVTVTEPSPPTPPVTPTGDILPFIATAIIIIVLIILIVYLKTKRK